MRYPNEVAELSEENNQLGFGGGAFLTPDGTLHVHGTDSAESIKINLNGPADPAKSPVTATSTSITIKIDEWMLDYDASSVQEIHLRLQGGNDVLNVQPQISQNIHVYGGAGEDRIVAGAGSDWLIGGTGDDFIAGHGNRDLLDGGDGDDSLLGGADKDSLLGFAGNDKLVGGSGKDILDGGDGRDIVDGGADDDLAWSGAGADRIVNPIGGHEARDAESDDTLLATTPNELIFGKLAVKDDGISPISVSSGGYGYGGYAGPFWIESPFSSTTYHPEGEEWTFFPFTVKRNPQDFSGLTPTIPITYTGTATAADFIWRQMAVTMSSDVSVGVQVYDDPTLESTETFTANIASGYDSSTGVYFYVGYPSTGWPSSDIDGSASSHTAYIVDGDLQLENGGMAVPESQEENPGGAIQIGELVRLATIIYDSPASGSFKLSYPMGMAVYTDVNRSQYVPSNSLVGAGVTMFYIEAFWPVTNAIVSLEWHASWNWGKVDRIFVTAVDLDIDSDNNNGYNEPGRTGYENRIEDDPAYPGKLVFVNSGDLDDDGAPDFADGYDIFGNQGSNASDPFTPLVFEVEPSSLSASATVTFTYDGSDPAGVTRTGDPINGYEYNPAPGHLRLWTKGGSESRLKAGLHSGGDYITPGVGYTLAQLGADFFGIMTVFVEAAYEAATSLQIIAQLDPDGPGPAPMFANDRIRISAPRVDLSVDTDRNGTIGRGPDERGEHRWEPERGAIFNVNFDRDGTNLDRIDNVHPESDAIAFYNDGKIETIINANGKPAIDNAADMADITPFMVRRILAPLPAGAKMFLRVDELEDIQSIQVYKKIAAGEEAIWGGLGNREENARNTPQNPEPPQPLEVEITPYLSATADTTFGLEGLFFRNTGTIHTFDGGINITLEMRLGTDVLRSDKVHLMVAPWIMLPNDQASERVFAADLPGNDEFRHTASADPGYVGLDHSGQLTEFVVTEYELGQPGPEPPPGTVLGTRWFQDHIEIGYTGRPGGPKDHIIFQLPYGTNLPIDRCAASEPWVSLAP